MNLDSVLNSLLSETYHSKLETVLKLGTQKTIDFGCRQQKWLENSAAHTKYLDFHYKNLRFKGVVQPAKEKWGKNLRFSACWIAMNTLCVLHCITDNTGRASVINLWPAAENHPASTDLLVTSSHNVVNSCASHCTLYTVLHCCYPLTCC